MEYLKTRPSEKYLIVAFLTLFIAIAIIWCLTYTRAYFTNYDAYDYAQMGREISSGHGFSTRQIFPRHIPFLSERGYLSFEHIPNLYRYPLPTLANAFFQIFASDVVQAAIIQSGVWFLASILIFFFLALRFSNTAIAILSTIVYFGDRSIWHKSYNGMTESLAILLLLLIATFIYSTKCSKWKNFFVGFLCGMAFLTRSQMFILFPLSTIFLWFTVPKSKRVRSIILVVIAFILVISPWMIRNIVVADNPLFSFSTSRNLVLDTSPMHSDLEMQLYAPINAPLIWEYYGTVILGKFFRNIWPEWIKPSSYTHNDLYAIFIVFIILASFIVKRKWKDSKYELFKWNVLTLVFVNFLTVSLTFHAERFYVIFHPLIIIVFFREFYFFLKWSISEQRKKFIYTVFVFLISIGLIRFTFSIMSTRGDPPFILEDQISYEILANLTPPQSVIASDISHKITLYNRNLTVRLPSKPKELLEISHGYLPIDYVVFSSSITNPAPSNKPSLFENYENYKIFRNSKDFLQEFTFVTGLPNGAVLYEKIES